MTVELPKEELVDGNGDEGESNTQLSDFFNVCESRMPITCLRMLK